MPDGERVTTGSEPRRFTLIRNGDMWAVTTSGRELFDADDAVEVEESAVRLAPEERQCVVRVLRDEASAIAAGQGNSGYHADVLGALADRLERVEVVEPDHDERAEDDAHRESDEARLRQALKDNVDHATRLDQLEKQTVEAVVEALRDRADRLALVGDEEASAALNDAADSIEERFNLTEGRDDG